MYTRSFRLLLSDTNVVTLLRSDTDFWFNVHTFCQNSVFKHTFQCFLASDTDFGLMYTHSARTLLSDTHFAVFLCCDTDFSLTHVRSVRILLPNTYFAVFLCFDADVGLMYTCSFRIMLPDTCFAVFLRSDTAFCFNVHTFCQNTLCCFLAFRHRFWSYVHMLCQNSAFRYIFRFFLRSDTDFGLMYVRSARLLLPDTYFAIFLRVETDVWLYVHKFFQNSVFKHTFCCFLAF